MRHVGHVPLVRALLALVNADPKYRKVSISLGSVMMLVAESLNIRSCPCGELNNLHSDFFYNKKKLTVIMVTLHVHMLRLILSDILKPKK